MPFDRLSTPQLCALWRKSAAALAGARTPASKARVAGLRAALLDELEGREPEAMAAWLADPTGEPLGPSAYLVRH
ncbi:hypothetical protein G5V58_19775 [Nocardioides anomalus]|uniref:Uncharacterized protein n=1 Tax=Nocardioides anomalus TaxID=2712223 RepID=A0A6G6WHM3_9ACTN|nr:hypothetical protein [Nocardioides anomalus]QIG44722.1 hypothetical protein G5V58_19775 [Nocardioides anomalus]